jgi:hypothetical protein
MRFQARVPVVINWRVGRFSPQSTVNWHGRQVMREAMKDAVPWRAQRQPVTRGARDTAVGACVRRRRHNLQRNRRGAAGACRICRMPVDGRVHSMGEGNRSRPPSGRLGSSDLIHHCLAGRQSRGCAVRKGCARTWHRHGRVRVKLMRHRGTQRAVVCQVRRDAPLRAVLLRVGRICRQAQCARAASRIRAANHQRGRDAARWLCTTSRVAVTPAST